MLDIKTGRIMVAFTLSLFLFGGFAEAKVNGRCDDCHTMHNSQDALSMKLDSTPTTGGPNTCRECHADIRWNLLRMDCLGCHAQNPNGGSNIVNGIPQIAHNAGTDLAGGNFRNVFSDDTHGHNVHGFPTALINTDNTLVNTPPGYNSSFDPSAGKYDPGYAAARVMCAGQNGCHGNRDELSQDKSVAGAHHGDDSSLRYGINFSESSQGTTVGNSYRFLYKVRGAEDDDWEATKSDSDHNGYRGAVFDAGRSSQTWADIETMSQLCAQCHGNFHAGATMGDGLGVWIRHPSDVLIPNTGPYAALSTYDPSIPVARQSIADSTSQALNTATAGEDIVFCLSCHRGHATSNSDSLRWDYTACNAATANPDCGCFFCHSDKD